MGGRGNRHPLSSRTLADQVDVATITGRGINREPLLVRELLNDRHQREERRRIVAVVDNHCRAIVGEQIEPAGRLAHAGVERFEASADLFGWYTERPNRSGGSEDIFDLERDAATITCVP